MEVPFDPEEQLQQELRNEKQASENLQFEIDALEKCPSCKKDASWKFSSGGLRCRMCGAYVGMNEKNQQVMMIIVLMKQKGDEDWEE